MPFAPMSFATVSAKVPPKAARIVLGALWISLSLAPEIGHAQVAAGRTGKHQGPSEGRRTLERQKVERSPATLDSWEAEDASAEPRNTSPCLRDARTACLLDDRFEVKVKMWNFANPPVLFPGRIQFYQGATSETDQSVSFFSFTNGNVELFVKMVDACDSNSDSFWLFAAGATNAEAEILVRDTESGLTRRIFNPRGQLFQTVADTRAFSCDGAAPTGVTGTWRGTLFSPTPTCGSFPNTTYTFSQQNVIDLTGTIAIPSSLGLQLGTLQGSVAGPGLAWFQTVSVLGCTGQSFCSGRLQISGNAIDFTCPTQTLLEGNPQFCTPCQQVTAHLTRQ